MGALAFVGESTFRNGHVRLEMVGLLHDHPIAGGRELALGGDGEGEQGGNARSRGTYFFGVTEAMAARATGTGEHLQGIPSGDNRVQLGGSDGVRSWIAVDGQIVGGHELFLDLCPEGPVGLFGELGNLLVHGFNFKSN